MSPILHPKSRTKVADRHDRRDTSILRHLRRQLSNQTTRLYPLVGWTALAWRWVVHRTVRMDRRGRAFDLLQKGEPFIFTYWHQDQLPLLFEISRSFPYMPPLYMVSPGRTGALASHVLSVVGVQTIAGSKTHKGWEAIDILTELVRKKPQSIFLLADGSRGPNMEARWGAVNLARDTGLPIIAGRGWGNNLIALPWTWMRLVLPLPRPFGRGLCLTSEPLYVSADATKEDLALARDELQRRLDGLTRASLDHREKGAAAIDALGPAWPDFPEPSAPEKAEFPGT